MIFAGLLSHPIRFTFRDLCNGIRYMYPWYTTAYQAGKQQRNLQATLLHAMVIYLTYLGCRNQLGPVLTDKWQIGQLA